jgi:hypothetical protein
METSVHRGLDPSQGWTSSIISKIWLFAWSGISKYSIFKNTHLENRFTQRGFKQFCFEEIRRNDFRLCEI